MALNHRCNALPCAAYLLVALPAVAAQGGADLACPGGIPGLGADFFEELAEFQRSYGRDDIGRSRGYFSSIWAQKIVPVLEEASELCLAAVTNVLVNSILAIDFDYGIELATLYWQEALLQISRYQEAFPARLFFGDGDTAQTYPLLLGMLQSERVPCIADGDGEAPRIYVYETDLVSRPLHCAIGQWGTEVLFHKFFERASCRTDNPTEADLFYVPVYGTCFKHFYLKEGIKDPETGGALVEPGKSYFDRLLDFLLSSPFWERRGGLDHIFLFADGEGSVIWDAVEMFRGRSHLLLTEAWCSLPASLERSRRHTFRVPCGSPWKDVVIPGHVDFHRGRELMRLARPLEDRDVLLSFQGRFPKFGKYYEHCEARDRLLELAKVHEMPGVEVSGYSKDYFDKLGRSVFCAVPAGKTPWTVHLYEAFFAACIPVILSDDYALPFPERIPWSELSVRWPEHLTSTHLVDHLGRLLLSGEVEPMRRTLAQHRCWIDYWSLEPACSPFVAATSQLARLVGSRPQHFGADTAFWKVPADIRILPARVDDCPGIFVHAALQGGDLEGVPPQRTANYQACHRRCRQHSHCRRWTWLPPGSVVPLLRSQDAADDAEGHGYCLLKGSSDMALPLRNAFSGPKVCGQDMNSLTAES